MTQQEHIDQLIRIHLGDLIVQIVMLKARITELEHEAQAARDAQNLTPEIIPENKPNGRHEKRVQDG